MKLVGLLMFKGKLIHQMELPQPTSEIVLYEPEHLYYGKWVAAVEGNKPKLLDRVTLYELVFDYKRTFHVDEARQIEYAEYVFSGIRPKVLHGA